MSREPPALRETAGPGAETMGGPDGATLLRDLSLAWYLAVNDLRMRYARSLIGPLWIVVQMAIFVGVLGVILAEVHGVPLSGFLPFFAVSLLAWNLMNSSVNEGTESLREGAGLIKDRGIRPVVPVMQTVLRTLLIAAHCLVVPAAAMVWFSAGSLAGLLLAIPGAVLFAVVTAALTVIVAGLAARFRDIKRMVETGLMLVFLSTPILWQPGVIRSSGRFIVDLNPVAHLFAAWREPLLEGRLPLASLGISAGLALLCAAGAWRALLGLRRATFWI